VGEKAVGETVPGGDGDPSCQFPLAGQNEVAKSRKVGKMRHLVDGMEAWLEEEGPKSRRADRRESHIFFIWNGMGPSRVTASMVGHRGALGAS
jgi:hypothetical protein